MPTRVQRADPTERDSVHVKESPDRLDAAGP